MGKKKEKQRDQESLMESLGFKEEKKSCFPTLTFKQRIIGFCVCFVLGIILQIISFVSFFTGKSLVTFAVLYSIGNLISVSGTFFLSGPAKQFKKMTDKTRLLTSIVFVVSLIMTIISACVLHMKLLVILFLILQFVSYFWYSLSYIPYARRMFTFCCKSIVE